MKKPKDEMRKEYKASDFKTLERGKYHAEVSKATAVALLDPVVAKAFPTSEAVNEALHGLLEIAAQASRITSPSSGRRRKRRAAAQ